MKKLLVVLSMGFLSPLVLLGKSKDDGLSSPQLFSSAARPTILHSLTRAETSPGARVVRSRSVRANLAPLDRGTEIGEDSSGGSLDLELNLFPDVSLRATLKPVRGTSFEGKSWFGHIDGLADSHVTLVLHKEILAGSIDLPDGRRFEMRHAGQGVYAVEEINPNALPDDLEPILVKRSAIKAGDRSAPGEKKAASAPLAANSVRANINLLVVYTREARAAAGGQAAIEASIQLAVAETNQAYANSLVNASLSLVKTAEISYDETSFDWWSTLLRLWRQRDGYLDEAHDLRDEFGADIVMLVVNANTSCGLSYMVSDPSEAGAGEYAFGVVSRECMSSSATLAHELGHIMGCAHDRDSAGGSRPATPYAFGYREPGRYRDIMAVSCPSGDCPRIPHFSSPQVFYQGWWQTGVPQGTSLAADTASALNLFAYKAQDYYQRIPAISLATTTAEQGGQINLWLAGSGCEEFTSVPISQGASPSEQAASIQAAFNNRTSGTCTSWRAEGTNPVRFRYGRADGSMSNVRLIGVINTTGATTSLSSDGGAVEIYIGIDSTGTASGRDSSQRVSALAVAFNGDVVTIPISPGDSPGSILDRLQLRLTGTAYSVNRHSSEWIRLETSSQFTFSFQMTDQALMEGTWGWAVVGTGGAGLIDR